MGSWIESGQLGGSPLTTSTHCLSHPPKDTSSDMDRDVISCSDPENHPKLMNVFQTTILGTRCIIRGFPYSHIIVLLISMHHGISIPLSETPGAGHKWWQEKGEGALGAWSLRLQALGIGLGSLVSQRKISPFPRMHKVKDTEVLRWAEVL